MPNWSPAPRESDKAYVGLKLDDARDLAKERDEQLLVNGAAHRSVFLSRRVHVTVVDDVVKSVDKRG